MLIELASEGVHLLAININTRSPFILAAKIESIVNALIIGNGNGVTIQLPDASAVVLAGRGGRRPVWEYSANAAKITSSG